MSESFSSINTYLRCAQKYNYKYVHNLQHKKQDLTLRQGTVIHRLLMAGFLYLQKLGPEDGWIEYALGDELVTLGDEAGDYEDEELDNMLAESALIVANYFNQRSWARWEILHVEEEFTIIIDGKAVTFTPDLVARDPFDKVWVIDHKSTSSVPMMGIPFSSQQMLLYYTGVKLHYPETVGFVFNYLRKKLPTQPRLNKTRDQESGLYLINNLNAIDTTFEVLFKFIEENAPELFAHEGTKRRLAELRDQDNRFFYTQDVFANEAA
ncbi:MAG: PD-(D/E)XK nuclease family protein, partial [Nitrososphaera sp.]|nr:PD-(D/E)XK nuclease family protein [Nitrososphaera sp.]